MSIVLLNMYGQCHGLEQNIRGARNLPWNVLECLQIGYQDNICPSNGFNAENELLIHYSVYFKMRALIPYSDSKI